MYYHHKVISNKVLNNKFNLIKLKTQNKNFKHHTGQFVSLLVKRNTYRAYSIASVPEKLPYWEVFVDITPGGPGTSYLKNLKKGDTIKTSSPKGQFLLKRSVENYIFAATGCGIAPLIPMIDEIINDKNKFIFLFWGLRNEKDITLTSKIEEFKKKNHNFRSEIVLSKPTKSWKGIGGHITIPLANKAKTLPFPKTKIYLSGSLEFVSETRKELEKNKISPNCIYFEACY